MTSFSLPLDPEVYEQLYDEMRRYYSAPTPWGDYRYDPTDPIDPLEPPVYDPRWDYVPDDDYEEEEDMPDNDDFLAPQPDKGVKRMTKAQLSHWARVYDKGNNVQEGLGLVVKETVGGAEQAELFEDFRPWD